MTDSDHARVVLVVLEPALLATRAAVLDAYPLLADGPLHAHHDADADNPELVADEILFALDHLRDALRRYRRLTRTPRAERQRARVAERDHAR